MKSEYISKWCGKILHIFDPIFMQNIYFVNAKNEIEFAEKIKSIVKIEPRKRSMDGGFKVIEGKYQTEICLIWGSSYSIIAHECAHAAHYILSRKDIPLNDETTEVYAYYIQFLVKEISRSGVVIGK